jgi:hypothetical protein
MRPGVPLTPPPTAAPWVNLRGGLHGLQFGLSEEVLLGVAALGP